MLFATSLLIPLLALSFWLFVRLSPARPKPGPVRIFNLASIAATLAITTAVTLMVRETMAGTSDHASWPVVAAFYALAVIPACLAVGGALRRLTFGPSTPPKPLELTRDLSKTRF